MVEENKVTKVEEKEVKEVKKLDDVKNTPENKKAIAESEGKVVEKKVEAKPVDKEKKAESKTELEREYIVPLRKGFLNVPHYRRAKKAVKILKEFMVRHMNIRDGDTRKVKVNIHLNNEIWFRGIRNPLHKIKVIAKKVDGIVYVELKDIPEVVGFKIAREARAAAAAIAKEKPVKNKKKVEKKPEADADKDGVDDKKEESEDRKAEAEKDAKTAKVETKDEKHSAKGEHKQKIASTKGLK